MPLPTCFWQSPASPLPLAHGAVHLWKLNLTGSNLPLPHLLEWLSPDEQERAESYSYEESRQDFILTRGSLRYLLGQYLDFSPRKIQFTYNASGKPGIDLPESGRRLQFNLAHSGGWVLMAFTWDTPVGVDIEMLSRRVDLQSMLPRVLSQKERETFASLPSEQQNEAFLLAWTQKEAYLKAIGSGLTRGLDEITVDIQNSLPKNRYYRSWGIAKHTRNEMEGRAGRGLSDRWDVYAFEVEPGVIGALAAERIPTELSCYTLLLDAEHLRD